MLACLGGGAQCDRIILLVSQQGEFTKLVKWTDFSLFLIEV